MAPEKPPRARQPPGLPDSNQLCDQHREPRGRPRPRPLQLAVHPSWAERAGLPATPVVGGDSTAGATAQAQAPESYKGLRRTVKRSVMLGCGQVGGRGQSRREAQVWKYLEVPPLQVQELGAPDVVPSEDVLILTETEALQPGRNLLCAPEVNCQRRESRSSECQRPTPGRQQQAPRNTTAADTQDAPAAGTRSTEQPWAPNTPATGAARAVQGVGSAGATVLPGRRPPAGRTGQVEGSGAWPCRKPRSSTF